MDIFSAYSDLGVRAEIWALLEDLEEHLQPFYAEISQVETLRQLRVLRAFQNNYLCEAELHGSTGYGYHDAGRDKLEQAFAESLEAEAAFLRWQFASGSQVLYQMLRALLRPGDELLIATGEVYDSLKTAVRSLSEQGITVNFVDLKLSSEALLAQETQFDMEGIISALTPRTAAVYVQKSRGYSLRPCLTSAQIGDLKRELLAAGFTKPLLVDNCYGEFVEAHEPTHYGADLIAGSLIKNPGGGIAPSGGYVAGRQDLVERVAEGVTAPGIGREIGPSLGHLRELGLGLYLAPSIVASALKTATLMAALFAKLGYPVEPLAGAERGDIVQIVALEDPEKLKAFCRAIQLAAPIDHHFTPEPSAMPGYDCDIIMASGSFTQGSSIELSADGPLRPPYAAFYQGSFNLSCGRLAALFAAQALADIGG